MTDLNRVSTRHLVSVLREKPTDFCTALLSKSLLGASLCIHPDTSTSHPLHTIHTGPSNDTGAAYFQGSSYRVRVFFNLVAYEIDVIVLLVVQNFFLILSLVV